ncbi:MAG: hypothetical protein P8078_08990, partial [bacterium]
MKRDVAEQVINRMIKLSDEICETINIIKKGSNEEEKVLYRHAIGRILADILDYIMRPIFQ